MKEFMNKIVPGETKVVVVDPDLVGVDKLLAEAKNLRESMDGLSMKELVAKYKEPLKDDEMGTYFENKKMKLAIQSILIDKYKLSGAEVERLLSE